MSVKSIDTQVMIARTADFARDTSATQKRHEVAQEYLAFREKINDAQNQSKVAKSPESELSKLHSDKNGGGANSGESGTNSGARKKGEDADEDMFVPSGDSIIDIKV